MFTQRLSHALERVWQRRLTDDQGARKVDVTRVAPGQHALQAAKDVMRPPEIAEQMQLIDFPCNEMTVTCKICDKRVRLRTQRLIAEHGRKERIADVIASLSTACDSAIHSGCELALEITPA
jgi:hypothetical protein